VTLQIYSLKIIGNIVTGNPLQTQAVIDSGVLPFLSKLIFHEKRSIRKETCWVISNIAAGTQQQIRALIINDFLPILETVIKNDEPDVILFLLKQIHLISQSEISRKFNLYKQFYFQFVSNLLIINRNRLNFMDFMINNF